MDQHNGLRRPVRADAQPETGPADRLDGQGVTESRRGTVTWVSRVFVGPYRVARGAEGHGEGPGVRGFGPPARRVD